MSWIKAQLSPHLDVIRKQEDPLAALAFQAYCSVRSQIEKIVNTDFGSGRLVLIGGIQLNMPTPYADHFLPIMFTMRQAGREEVDLLEAFDCPISESSIDMARTSSDMARI